MEDCGWTFLRWGILRGPGWIYMFTDWSLSPGKSVFNHYKIWDDLPKVSGELDGLPSGLRMILEVVNFSGMLRIRLLLLPEPGTLSACLKWCRRSLPLLRTVHCQDEVHLQWCSAAPAQKEREKWAMKVKNCLQQTDQLCFDYYYDATGTWRNLLLWTCAHMSHQ